MTICTDRFETLARITGEGLGRSNLPLVVIPHPLAGLKPEEVIRKADAIIDQIAARLTE